MFSLSSEIEKKVSVAEMEGVSFASKDMYVMGDVNGLWRRASRRAERREVIGGIVK